MKIGENYIKKVIKCNFQEVFFLNYMQIFLLIFNERLYNSGQITKEQRDKIITEINDTKIILK